METETRPGAEGSGEQPERSRSRVERFGRRSWWTRPAVLIIAVTALASGLRFYHLAAPHEYVFDEVWYAKDGCLDAGFPYKDCKLTSNAEQTFTVHPPLGRWIIAGGEALFGNRPFGWRFSSAVFGILSVLLTAILTYLLFGGGWGGVAGLLLATESLNFVQSRVSMLDIILTTFVVAGFLCLVLDRRWMARRTGPPGSYRETDETGGLLSLPPDRPPSPLFRPWRLLAGVAFGAALATKWSGGLALFGAVLLAFAWERSRRKEARQEHPGWQAFRDELLGLFLFLVMVPVAVYLASYARYFADHGFDLTAWYQVQRGMAEFSIQLRASHPYASRPWTWPIMTRPVAYYYKGAGSGASATSAEILGMGNPVVFWLGLPALVWTFGAWIKRRDWRAGLIVVAFGAQYFLWYLAARTAFLFYMTPITPFMVLAGVYGLRDMWEARIGETETRALAPLAAMLVVASIGMFAFFFPVLVGRTMSYQAWHLRMWFRSWI